MILRKDNFSDIIGRLNDQQDQNVNQSSQDQQPNDSNQPIANTESSENGINNDFSPKEVFDSTGDKITLGEEILDNKLN